MQSTGPKVGKEIAPGDFGLAYADAQPEYLALPFGGYSDGDQHGTAQNPAVPWRTFS